MNSMVLHIVALQKENSTIWFCTTQTAQPQVHRVFTTNLVDYHHHHHHHCQYVRASLQDSLTDMPTRLQRSYCLLTPRPSPGVMPQVAFRLLPFYGTSRLVGGGRRRRSVQRTSLPYKCCFNEAKKITKRISPPLVNRKADTVPTYSGVYQNWQ